MSERAHCDPRQDRSEKELTCLPVVEGSLSSVESSDIDILEVTGGSEGSDGCETSD